MLSYRGAGICQASATSFVDRRQRDRCCPSVRSAEIGGSSDSTAELCLVCGETFLNALYICLV